ncbi:MAG: AAA family ATPase [Phycisphaeraceae bacterium]|nr:AAA family ATPase [Phycisphaeraceae bacterium]
MYENFYNLLLPPFANTPNSRFFFETEQHREALAKLEYVVRNRRGFALVTGEVGSGKTTLTRTLLRRLGSEVRACLINNTRVSSTELVKMISSEFQLDLPEKPDKATYLTAMRRFVEHQYAIGRNVVIIIDEGQCLSIDELEELRLLTNLENETDKLVQLLILGQPELRAMLKHERLKPLIQRIAMYTHLGPMSFDDMTKYIAYRLVRASNERPNVDFSREALQMIYQRSSGIPRVVNLVCDNALLVGYSRNTRLIDSSVVRRAVDQMMPNFNNEGFGPADLGEDATLGNAPDEMIQPTQEYEDGRRL